MDKKTFNRIEQRYQPWIKEIESICYELHRQTNQKYDETLPYGFHLKLAASFVSKYGYLVADKEADVLILFAAAYLHDTIEDARLSYNDVVHLMKNFRVDGITPDEESRSAIESLVPEIVYALTNEKGRTRRERANENYYKGIRETRFAPFLKMCDRMGNIRYGTLFASKSRMFDVYREEHNHFIESIGKGAITPIPEEMEQELRRMLSVEEESKDPE
jgi:(p)ppGpp synthase/HD superfamily hydrolase